MALTFRTSERTIGGVTVVDISGRVILGDGSRELGMKLTELVKAGQNKILLNLGNVPYMDSSGVGELVSAYSTTTKAGGKIKLLNLQPRLAEILKMTNLEHLFESYSAESDAVASFAYPPAA